MIVNCIGIGADEEEGPNGSRFRGLKSKCNKLFGLFLDSLSYFYFLVCSSILSFVSIKCLKDYEISGFIEMNCDKFHIDLF